MILDEQRTLHEEIERLEQAIAERVIEEPEHIRYRLNRDHEISNFLQRIQDQSTALLNIYKDVDGARLKEIQSMGNGDASTSAFYDQLNEIKSFHRRYPNEPTENLERAYKRRAPGDDEPKTLMVDTMFSGEEGFGKFMDLTTLHETYINLPGVKDGRRSTYIQYLDIFDKFAGIKKADKMSNDYFKYLGDLAAYLEGFMRRTRPLENVDKILGEFYQEFETAWEEDKVEGWGSLAVKSTAQSKTSITQGTGVGVWCSFCEKEFTNQNLYKHHAESKKHKKVVAAKEAADKPEDEEMTDDHGASSKSLKDRAIAEREFRIKKLAAAMSSNRSDTRVNVERKQGMTERERQQELDALMMDTVAGASGPKDDDDDEEDKIYNPLKLPLAWDGKPIPFWLYKLHGLGVEFPCEICGNFVYMGRRAFDKHFNESRHVYGLKCLGITSMGLFREITHIEEALRLWEKIQKDKKKEKAQTENVVQMEDSEGNVMPEKIYYDLLKQGLL